MEDMLSCCVVTSTADDDEGMEAMASEVLLHGVLEVNVFKADHLHCSIQGLFIQGIEKVERKLQLNNLIHSKLYATVDIGKARVARTREAEFQPKNPIWNQSFRIYCAHTAPWIVVSVKNQLPVSAKVLGRAKISTSQLLRQKEVYGWFSLFSDSSHTKRGKVLVSLKFSDVTSDPCWNSGIGKSQFSGIPNAYFPQKTGCNVTLYQNSHLSDNFRPVIRLSNGTVYQPPRLWEDLYNYISKAKYFIYVAGWSVNVSITLVRDPDRMIAGAQGVTVGELLKRKAEQGVNVLVMVWQDRTSISFLGNAGLMKTHDEETYKFFEGSKVKCFLCPRTPDPSLTAVQHVEVGTEFTHHQKTVILDAPLGNGDRRQIVSFVGGIDLCDGRYDDERHTLFRNLDSTYRNDFMQNNFQNADLKHGGPREPWHDVHSKIEGPSALDVLINFEQRWKKQSPKQFADALLNIQQLPDIDVYSHFQGGESWNVQVFRSIDDASVVGFPVSPAEAFEKGLTSGKDVIIDQSIHSGYVEAIRRAKRFIYIENQYFLGSCFAWSEEQDSGCLNLIPMEIALKIASKIRMGDRFAAYIVTPMWPEGIPESDTVQAILRFNRLTMEMMYRIVSKAIEDAGLRGKAHPSDYLNFFCLGNREIKGQGEYVPPEKPEPGTDYWKAQTNRRFPIYVHAKLMIVDDEYVIVGSANLNQRSLEGDRDTEIAQGAYQPAHTNHPYVYARGTVHAYRMSLWYEHFMSNYYQLYDLFLMPEKLECVRKVRKIAEDLWKKYVQNEVVELPGHLLPFPILVSQSGELSDLPTDGLFPDTSAPVKGKKTVLPPLLTT